MEFYGCLFVCCTPVSLVASRGYHSFLITPNVRMLVRTSRSSLSTMPSSLTRSTYYARSMYNAYVFRIMTCQEIDNGENRFIPSHEGAGGRGSAPRAPADYAMARTNSSGNLILYSTHPRAFTADRPRLPVRALLVHKLECIGAIARPSANPVPEPRDLRPL